MKNVIMPKLGFTMTESTIVQWIKGEGDYVEQGEPIAEVTTDKVNMEVEAPASGTLAGLKYKEGDTVPVTEVIAYILKTGESVPQDPSPASHPNMSASTNASGSNATPVAARAAQELGVDLARVPGTGAGGKVTREDVEAFAAKLGGKMRATPAARRLARESGIDLATLQGSGPNGRVQARDVEESSRQKVADKIETAIQSPVSNSQAPISVLQSQIPYAGMRKTIGTRLQQSYQQAPHVTFDIDVDVSAAEALRSKVNAQLREGQVRVSLTAIIAKACAWALLRHPLMNARLDLAADQIILNHAVHLGIAVALDEGLVVPVVRDAQAKGIRQIADEVADLAMRTKANKLRADEMGGGTFTISNLGMFGVDVFTAIINPPETGILAVGRARKRFVPDAHDQPVLKPILTVRLSADHRVVDGAVAAKFLSDIRVALEDPAMMAV
jgi:pyruvate dehydrogenase E2 component (dihydrolipoamide acetyltransferase)